MVSIQAGQLARQIQDGLTQRFGLYFIETFQKLHGERFAEQTAEEAAQLEEYNRYLAELAAADDARSGSQNR